MIKSLWHINKTTSKILEENQDEQIDTTPILSLYSMISDGTERLVASGNVPTQLQDEMKVAHMGGSFRLPIKYGYSLVGRNSSGRLVHLMHPHQNILFVKAETLSEVPNNISPQKATLVSNMETTINGVWDAKIRPDDKILILGFGNIGSLLAQTIWLMTHCKVDILETDDWRKEKAKQLGWNTIGHSHQNKYDIVYNTTSNAAAMCFGLNQLKVEGKLIEMSWYGDSTVSLPLGLNFHYNRLRIISSQVSRIPLDKSEEWDYKKRKALGFQLLDDPYFDKVITNIISFDEAPDHFDKLRNAKSTKELITLIKY